MIGGRGERTTTLRRRHRFTSCVGHSTLPTINQCLYRYVSRDRGWSESIVFCIESVTRSGSKILFQGRRVEIRRGGWGSDGFSLLLNLSSVRNFEANRRSMFRFGTPPPSLSLFRGGKRLLRPPLDPTLVTRTSTIPQSMLSSCCSLQGQANELRCEANVSLFTA